MVDSEHTNHITLSGDGCPKLSIPLAYTTKWSLWDPPTWQNAWLYQILTLTLPLSGQSGGFKICTNNITLSGDGYPSLARHIADTPKCSLWIPSTWQNACLYQDLTLTSTSEWSKCWIHKKHYPHYIKWGWVS